MQIIVVVLFEDLQPTHRYDSIFASHILEHLLDVPVVLNLVKNALTPKGCLFARRPECACFIKTTSKAYGAN